MKSYIAILIAAFIGLVAAQSSEIPDPGFASEITSLDFANIIGGPMNAVVSAQAAAAITTTDFINNVGFRAVNETYREVNTVCFDYKKLENETLIAKQMCVPLLVLIPIPYIEITELKIEFNVKLNSVGSSFDATNTQFNASLRARASWGWGSARLNASYSRQKKERRFAQVKREYSLNIKVVAGQASIPRGMDRLLDLFDEIIQQ